MKEIDKLQGKIAYININSNRLLVLSHDDNNFQEQCRQSCKVKETSPIGCLYPMKMWVHFISDIRGDL